MEPLTDKCPYCRRHYVYPARLISHVKTSHRDLYYHFQRLYDIPRELDERSDSAAKRPRYSRPEPEDPADSEEEYETDSSTDDHEYLNPREGELLERKETTVTEAGKTYDPEHCTTTDESGNRDDVNPWAPFQSEEDYYLGEWFIRHEISQAAIEDYFQLAKRFPNAFFGGSFTSSYMLFKCVDKMTYDLGWNSWKSGNVTTRLPEDVENSSKDAKDHRNDAQSTFFYRNPLSCIEFLMRQKRLADNFVYEPYKEYNAKGARIYGEMHTGDWWWRAQVRSLVDLLGHETDEPQHDVPKGSTILPVICSSDQTHLTNFSGDKKVWPVYLTVGNIPYELRNKPSELLHVLIALLPIPPKLTASGKGKTKNDERQRVLSRDIIRTIMQKVMKPLTDVSEEGKFIKCPDGAVRKCFPRVCAWIADHAENVVLHSVKTTACVVCEVPRTSFGDLIHPPCVYPRLRKGSDYLKLLLEYETQDDGASLDALKAVDVKAIEGCFWALDGKGVCLETLPRPDMLHTVYLGILKHLMEWLTKFLEAHSRLHLFNQIWKLAGDYPGHISFNKEYSATSQWTGREMRSLGRILLPILAASLQAPTAQERPLFHKAIRCVRYLIYFHLMLQYKTHDDETISLMRHYLAGFHTYKDVFNPYRAGKATKREAAAMKTALIKEQVAACEADSSYKKLTAAEKRQLTATNNAEVEKEVARFIDMRTKYDFVKIHYLEHFIEHINLFGNVQAFSSELLECTHRLLKDGYRASNKINATKQILIHITRMQAFENQHLQRAHLQDQNNVNAIMGHLGPLPWRLKGKVTKLLVNPKRFIRKVSDICDDYEFESDEFAERLECAIKKLRDDKIHEERETEGAQSVSLNPEVELSLF
jgi:hypothetical protein